MPPFLSRTQLEAFSRHSSPVFYVFNGVFSVRKSAGLGMNAKASGQLVSMQRSAELSANVRSWGRRPTAFRYTTALTKNKPPGCILPRRYQSADGTYGCTLSEIDGDVPLYFQPTPWYVVTLQNCANLCLQPPAIFALDRTKPSQGVDKERSICAPSWANLFNARASFSPQQSIFFLRGMFMS